jgi:hypothetical protein
MDMEINSHIKIDKTIIIFDLNSNGLLIEINNKDEDSYVRDAFNEENELFCFYNDNGLYKQINYGMIQYNGKYYEKMNINLYSTIILLNKRRIKEHGSYLLILNKKHIIITFNHYKISYEIETGI